MRLSVDGSGRIDPGRMLAVKALAFSDVYEAHVAQDAMDQLQKLEREKAKREARNRQNTPRRRR
jgi:hypothetical protein